MKKIAGRRYQQQAEVNTYFQSKSMYWKEIYASDGAYAEIHRDRYAMVLDWIGSFSLTPDSKVLEIGCGAGYLSVALALRGFHVRAIDSVEAMVEQARRHAAESGAAEMLSVNLGDVYSLAFEDGSFDLVIAIGVIPWLGRPELAIKEMARVTRPGGYVILTADNRWRLNNILDPWLNPVLTPLKRRVKDVLDRVGLRRRALEDIGATSHSRRFIDLSLERVELVKTKSMTLGFGPFSLFRRTILPEALGTKFHRRLQRLADQNMPVFRSTGAHYIVLARKSAPLPLVQSTSAERPISDITKVL